MKQLLLSLTMAISCSAVFAAHPALENEVLELSRAVPKGSPPAEGKGTWLLESRPNGKTLEVFLMVDGDTTDWRKSWENRLCSDLPARRILGMGGTIEVRAEGRDKRQIGVAKFLANNCAAFGKPIKSAEAQPSSVSAPSPSP